MTAGASTVQAPDLASLMLTTQETAVVFRLSERTIARRIAKGVIPVVDVGDGCRVEGAFVAFVLAEARSTGRAVLEVLGTAWAAMREAAS